MHEEAGPMQPDEIQIEVHAPERGRRAGVVTVGCGCCCCCCCLHTIGGLIGAAAAPVFGAGAVPTPFHYDVDDPDTELPPLTKPGLSAISVYWFSFLILTVLGGLIGLANGIVGIVFLVLGLPLVQIAAVVVSAILLAFNSRSVEDGQLWTLGKIALGIIVGTGLGVASMFGIGFLYSGMR
jgi:hypothetical protein